MPQTDQWRGCGSYASLLWDYNRTISLFVNSLAIKRHYRSKLGVFLPVSRFKCHINLSPPFLNRHCAIGYVSEGSWFPIYIIFLPVTILVTQHHSCCVLFTISIPSYLYLYVHNRVVVFYVLLIEATETPWLAVTFEAHLFLHAPMSMSVSDRQNDRAPSIVWKLLELATYPAHAPRPTITFDDDVNRYPNILGLQLM